MAQQRDMFGAWVEAERTKRPVPSASAAQRAQDSGIDKSVEHAGQDWLDYAKRFMRAFCERHATVFCDDVWEAGLRQPASPRAFGAVMKHAMRQGWISPSGEQRRSRQSNNAYRMVYVSNLYSTTKGS